MKRILVIAGLIVAVILIALVTRDQLPRVEEAADTVPAAIPTPGTPGDTAAPDSLLSDSLATDSLPGGGMPQTAPGAPVPGAAGGAGNNGAAASGAPSAGGAGSAGPVATSPATSTSSQLTVAQILARAATAYEGVQSMQAEFAMTMTNPLLRRTTNSAGTLYQLRPDRIALRFSQPDGDRIVSDGEHFWVYYPSVDAKQVIRMPASQGASGGVDLQAQFIGDPSRRFEATLHGTENVGGRSTYVVTLVPRQPVSYESLKVWLDTDDYLARRFEIDEENGSVRRFDLSGLRTNVPLGDDVFRFTPPADARIIDRR